jgi:hypothetical protein
MQHTHNSVALIPIDVSPLRSHINGQLFHIVPGRLLAFPCPVAGLAPGQKWADTDGRRAFGPGFYADLFHHLGVSAVLCLDPAAAAYDPAAFAAAGIPVIDIVPRDAAAAATAASASPPDTEAAGACGGGGGGDGGVAGIARTESGAGQAASLAALDRLVQTMDAAPGLVALQFPAADAGARALVAAYIARRSQPPQPRSPVGARSPTGRRRRSAEAGPGGFEAAEAVAWLHMARPCPFGGWRRS